MLWTGGPVGVPAQSTGAAVAMVEPSAGRADLERLRHEVEVLRVELQAARTEARTDYLTGLGNARALGETLDKVERAADPLPRCAVLFVDIDHFGDFNRHHGEAAGDGALQQVAAALRDTCGGRHAVYRKGGEEFVVLVSPHRSPDPRDLAAAVRHRVQSLGIAHDVSPTAPLLTVTVGVAEGPAGSVRTLLDRAARAAFHGKNTHHRNEVHCFADLVSR
jgi:diguanylate cyclase (GGDEF)-like protein